MKDMRVLGGLLVLFFSFFTFGCRNHISNDMSLSTSISQSITNEQTSVESKKSFKEFYKPVFDNYQKYYLHRRMLMQLLISIRVYKALNGLSIVGQLKMRFIKQIRYDMHMRILIKMV